MWTNVFRIGEFHLISWFQFLPYDSDPNSLSEKSLKAEQTDAATRLVLSAHQKLQNDGFLTAWTNSFVGPWDPSQGVHNPDEKIKLWLFLPGRHTSVVEAAKAFLSRLRVVGSGIWLAPGDSEEVAVALSQALRNRIERSLRGYSYVRFGDVFTRCHSFSTMEKNSRRVQPTCEFIFSATEEAIYVHAIISAKNVRGLSSNDLERVSKHCSCTIREGLPVIVAPNGMRGRFTGCCPSDFVKQVYSSKATNDTTVLGVPSHSPVCQLRGQSCYVEVSLGCPTIGSQGAALQLKSNPLEEHLADADERDEQKHGLADQFPILERTFVFPVETVLVPILHRTFVKSYLKRLWLQSCSGASVSDAWPSWNLSTSSFITHCLGFGSPGDIKFTDGLLLESTGVHPWCKYNNRSNSNSSSISSTSSTSSDSDDTMASGAQDLEADADSLTCRQTGLSSNDHFENECPKMVSKRPRTESFGQAGTVASGTVQVPVTAGIVNNQFGTFWDLDDADKGVGVDIETLLSEFGEFGDFFEDDDLAFGEPPGTAESQALMFSAADGGDIGSSPCVVGRVDAPDQNLLPALSFPPFEEFNQLPPHVNDEVFNKNPEIIKDSRESAAVGHSTAPSSNKYDYLTKVEAMMTLASEYSAVETPTSEFSTSIFRSPYLPKSKRVESPQSGSFAYVYSAAPPSSLHLVSSEEKDETSSKTKLATGVHDMGSLKYYSYAQGRKNHIDKKTSSFDDTPFRKEDITSSVSGVNLPSSETIVQRNKPESMLEARHLLLSMKTVLATEVECSMFQASMCRIRHALLSCNNKFHMTMSRLTGQTTDQVSSDPTITSSLAPCRYEVKKKDSIPVRIAGDIDGMLDRPISAPVGVWRSVGAPKPTKSFSTLNIENSSPFTNSSAFVEEDLPMSGQRQPLQELLDALPLLVQQLTSFVDISLDTCDGDGPYDWLAIREQRQRGFSCGPSMVHAGCGGLLATCHSVDIAGVDLIDPLSADVHASSVNSLLQSDIKVALKSAFGNLDGPLSVTDWCKGHKLSGDATITGETHSNECNASDAKDSSNTVTFGGDPISPMALTGGTSSLKDGARMDDLSQRRSNQETELQMNSSRFRPTVSVLPLPALLVGYQDDWLKTSANSLELWEKAPLEPYALPKHMTYYAVCPDVDILTAATADFVQQLGTIYEACNLGSHSPHLSGSQSDLAPKKWSTSGLVLVDCPQSIKVGGFSTSTIGSISDYLLALSKAWDLKTFLTSLTKVLKSLKLGSNSTINQKDGSNVPCMVVYVICPFPDPTAILQTLVESSAALGSVIYASEKEGRSVLHSQIVKSLSCAAAADEASVSNVLMLSGFSAPKLVLQIVSVDLLLRINRPRSELAILKELAFTVYNKARRIPRSLNSDTMQSSSASGRSQSTLMHVSSPTPGLWKDCLAPRISASGITREGELDSALRPGTWDNSWQTLRTGGLSCDPSRSPEVFPQDDVRYLFEPLFILAEAGSVEHGVSLVNVGGTASDSSNSRSLVDDSSSSYMQTSIPGGVIDVGTSSLHDGSEHDQKIPSLHCCYGLTEDWRWLICIWTDSRGELLDSQIFPFGGISSRQDTKVLQFLFVQVLHQGCQILSSSSPDSSSVRARDIIITRIGCFFELECQEWQKAIYSVGGNEVKKWPIQLRRSVAGISSSNNGTSLQQQDIGLMQERSISSSPGLSMYSPHAKSSSYMKGALGQTNLKKTLSAGQTVDGSRGLFHLVQSISLIGVSIDHSLHLMLPADVSSSGGATQTSSNSTVSGYLDGFSPVKSLGTISSSYMFIPSPSMRYLPPTPLQLPTCLTSESPPLAHLLHSKGLAIPLSTGYVVSKAVPSVRRDPAGNANDEWPSILSVSLVDHYGGNSCIIQEKISRSGGSSNSSTGSGSSSSIKQGRGSGMEFNSRDYEIETHLVLESVAAELHSLSWMTVSPVYPERRTALPFHCDMLLRLRRLLHYADKELSRPPEKK